MNRKKSIYAVLMAVGVIGIVGCKKNIPKERLSLGTDAVFNTTEYRPVLGRNTLFSENFNPGTSSLPLDFKIVNMRRFTGEAAPELNDYFDVPVWKSAYLGNEKSLEEIEKKRAIEAHQLFEIRKNSGQFMMWSKADSRFVKAQPDSGYVFDVEVSNSGGRKYYRNLKLRPFRERPFEPSNLNPLTGQATTTTVSPTILSNIRGERTGNFIGDVQVFFKQVNTTGNTLTFKFVDTLFNPIDPNKFAATKWDEVVHGFDMVKDSEKVTYKVAYPIPLANYPTIYTSSDGNFARAVFRYERQGFGNIKETAMLGMNFSIFQKGDWEIIFWFRSERPKFVND